MTSPFVYLLACTLKNRVLSRLRRLREPRYLVGAIVGTAYLYLVFFRKRMGRVRWNAARPGDGLLSAAFAPLQLVGTMMLWALVLARWIVPVSRQPIECTKAEAHLLLTAPVTRRRVIRYKLLRSLGGIFVSSALMILIASSALPTVWPFLIGLFLLFSAIRLHLLGVALARDTFAHGEWRAPAGLVAAAITVLGSIGMLMVVGPAAAHFAATGDWASTLAGARAAAAQPFIAAALFPFQAMIRPMVAPSAAAFGAAVLPAFALVVLNYLWVLRAEEVHARSVDEAEHATTEGQRRVARPVSRRAPFELAAQGRPEWAIVWKNLLMLGRYLNSRTLLRVAIPVLAFTAAMSLSVMTRERTRGGELLQILGVLAPVMFCFVTVLGPYMSRNDLRQDLPRLPVLKTWPVSGEQLLRGQVLAPAILLSVIAWLLLAVTGLVDLVPAAGSEAGFALAGRLAVGVGALVLSPAIIVAQLTIQNGFVVLFPAWVPTGPTQPRGIEAMGQQMLLLGGTMLLLVLGVLPGAIFGALFLWLAAPWIGWLAIVPAAWLLAALLVAEAYVALHFLGMLLEATDPLTEAGS